MTRGSSSGEGAAPWRARPGPRWPIFLIQLLVTLLYGANALAKTTGYFLNGDVLAGLSRMLSNFTADLSSGSLHLGLIAVPVWLLAVGTVATEYALALGFWFRRLRWPTAALGIVFHAVSTLVVSIEYLHVVCVVLYSAFLLPFDRPGEPARRPAVHRGAVG